MQKTILLLLAASIVFYVCQSGELEKFATAEESSVVQKEGNRQEKRKVKVYNLDAIISIDNRLYTKCRYSAWHLSFGALAKFCIRGFVRSRW